jgi:hypothetical protein
MIASRNTSVALTQPDPRRAGKQQALSGQASTMAAQVKSTAVADRRSLGPDVDELASENAE